MNNKYKYLSKNFILFSISNFGPKIIVFILIPIYTNYLSSVDYGIGDIINTSVNLILPILMGCVETSMLRFCFDKNYSTDEIITNGLYIYIRGVLICISLIIILGISSIFRIKYLIFFFLMFLSLGLYNILSDCARGLNKIKYMVEMSLMVTIINCLLNILLLVVFKYELDGFLISNFLGVFLSAIWGGFRLKIYQKIKYYKIKKEIINELQRFGYPLVFNKIGWWLNSCTDRYIITAVLGLELTGVYTISYKIPTILTTFSNIFAQSWQLSAIKDFDSEDKDNFISNMYEFYNSILVLSCSLLIIFTIPLAKILYAKSFFIAWKYVPPLLISFIFGGLSGFLGSIFTAVKETKIFSYSTLIGAIVNIILNFILIFYIQVMGAAIATLISNIIIWVIRLKKSRDYIKIKFNYKKHIFMYISLFIQFLICLKGFKSVSIMIQFFILLMLTYVNRATFFKIIKR